MALSLQGKLNQLAILMREHMPAAASGLAVYPLVAGDDELARPGQQPGRIFWFDVTGGFAEAASYYAVGSGGLIAMSALKKTVRGGMTAGDALVCALSAFRDAFDDDAQQVRPMRSVIYFREFG